MDLPGLEDIDIITRADARPPCLEVLVIQRVNGQYCLTQRSPSGPGGCSLSTQQMFEIGAVLYHLAEHRVNRLLAYYDRRSMGHQARLDNIRQRHGLESPLELFSRQSNIKNEFFIDHYLIQHPTFLYDVADFFADLPETVFNEAYDDELLLAATLVLFGPYVADYSWELARFMVDRVDRAMIEMEGGTGLEANRSPQLVAFDKSVYQLVQQEMASDAQGFLLKLQNLVDSITIPGEIVVALIPKILLVQIINDEGDLEDEYLGLPQQIEQDSFYQLLGLLTGPKRRSNFNIDNVLFRGTEQLFGEGSLARGLGDRIWVQLPQQYIGGKKARDLFGLFNTMKVNRWGKPSEPRNKPRDDVVKITLIRQHGLFGFPKAKPHEIRADPVSVYEDVDQIYKERQHNKYFLKVSSDSFRLFSRI